MNCFHDYFLFHYDHPLKRKIIKDFLINNNFSAEIEASVLSVEFSLFEFVEKRNDVFIFKDLLKKKNLV